MRDEVIDYVGYWTGRTELPVGRLVGWVGIGRSKYHAWKCDRHRALSVSVVAAMSR